MTVETETSGEYVEVSGIFPRRVDEARTLLQRRIGAGAEVTGDPDIGRVRLRLLPSEDPFTAHREIVVFCLAAQSPSGSMFQGGVPDEAFVAYRQVLHGV